MYSTYSTRNIIGLISGGRCLYPPLLPLQNVFCCLLHSIRGCTQQPPPPNICPSLSETNYVEVYSQWLIPQLPISSLAKSIRHLEWNLLKPLASGLNLSGHRYCYNIIKSMTLTTILLMAVSQTRCHVVKSNYNPKKFLGNLEAENMNER